MMSYLTRPATPKAVPVARELMAKGTKPIEKKIEKKVVKVAKGPKPTPNGPTTLTSEDWDLLINSTDFPYELFDDSWTKKKRAGLLEFELADEYWRGLYEEYKKKGGTLNFKEFMEEQTSTSSANGITSVLKI